jgi:hypothetical protein
MTMSPNRRVVLFVDAVIVAVSRALCLAVAGADTGAHRS